MPEGSGTKNRGFAVVLVVILVAAVALGGSLFYFRNASNPQNEYSTQQFTTSSCSATKPLGLVQVKGVFKGSGQSSLDLVWGNCASSVVRFTLFVSVLNVTVSTGGSASTVKAFAEVPPGHYSIQPGRETETVLPIYFSSYVSPNAVILHVSGGVYAEDPATLQPISAAFDFTA